MLSGIFMPEFTRAKSCARLKEGRGMKDVIRWYAAHTWSLVPTAYAVMSAVTFIVYAMDKRAARRGAWRTPESTLHLLELFCGWPGALFAQACFRHKWKKLSYMVVFWLCVIVNVTAVLCILFPGEARSLVESGLAALKRS